MTPAEHIRHLRLAWPIGTEFRELCAAAGYSRQQIYAALKASPKRGRPRKGKVCSTCKRPWPND